MTSARMLAVVAAATDLAARLDPWRGGQHHLRARCGACDRVFGRISPDGKGAPVIIVEGVTEPGRRPGADWPRKHQWIQSSPSPDGRTRETWHCRCGVKRIIRNERLAEAYLRAVQAGRKDIVIGVDA